MENYENENKNTPVYAGYDSPAKFQAIISIIGRHLKEHPNAACSYSGGSDSDILIDLIEKSREIFLLPPVHYTFFNTGLEMKAIKDHVKETAKKYNVEIEEYMPIKGYIKVKKNGIQEKIKHKKAMNIVNATAKYGLPIISKEISE